MNKHDDILEAQKELIDVLTNAARRCAYDLRHAADSCNDKFFADFYNERADHWLSIFNPVDGPKHYVSRLHAEMTNLHKDIVKLKAICITEGGLSEKRLEELMFWRDI